MSTRNAPARCTAQPDVALAMTLPRLFRPMIKAAAESEKPTELSTAGVQNVTVTSTMNTMKKGTQSSTVGMARPSLNRCFTGTPSRAGSGGAISSAPAGTAPGMMRSSVRRTSSWRMPRASKKRIDSGSQIVRMTAMTIGATAPI
jgi:hypothetical protein